MVLHLEGDMIYIFVTNQIVKMEAIPNLLILMEKMKMLALEI
jgi:hypothetical protein